MFATSIDGDGIFACSLKLHDQSLISCNWLVSPRSRECLRCQVEADYLVRREGRGVEIELAASPAEVLVIVIWMPVFCAMGAVFRLMRRADAVIIGRLRLPRAWFYLMDCVSLQTRVVSLDFTFVIMDTWFHAIFLTGAGFLSGWVDSIAGGGGLISLPALLWIGLPPVAALGTNKVAASFGSSTSAARYTLAGQVKRIAWPMAGVAFAASGMGARTAIALPERLLEAVLVTALLAVATIVALQRDFGERARPWPHGAPAYGAAAAVCAATIGFYDGLVGPGTGTFLAFSFVTVLGSDLLKATGSTKVVNFATNLAAAILFALGGHVRWPDAAMMGVGILTGAYIGSGMAIRIGPRLIRPIFPAIALAVAAKMLFRI